MSYDVIGLMQGPFCGTLATIFLYGVTCTQVFHYATNYSSDQQTIKWLVGGIWFLETVHTAFSIHFVEYYLILHFDDPEAVGHEVWSLGASYIVGSLVAWVVDLFFVWRIWQLSKQGLICIFLAALVTASTGIGVENSMLGLKGGSFQEFFSKIHPTMVAGRTLAALADTLIAITLCCYLYTQRNGIKRTNHVVNTLLLYTINTGALTSLFSILIIITYLTLPLMTFSAFLQVQSKLYAVSVFASLNARKTLVENAERAFPTTDRLSLSLVQNARGKTHRSLSRAIVIRKDVDQEIFPSSYDDRPYAGV